MQRSVFVIGVLACSLAQAATLTSVGVLDASDPYSSVRAMSPDGTWVAGSSRAVIVINSGTGETAMRETPALWSEATGLLQIVNPSGADSNLRGVDIRPGKGTGGVDQILMAGIIGGIIRTRKADVTDPTGGSWTLMPDTPYARDKYQLGEYNQIRTDTVVGDARWFMPYTLSNATNRFGRWRGDPNVLWDVSAEGQVGLGGVSGNGIVVGTHRPGGSRRAIYSDVPNGFLAIPGGLGIRSEGLGISSNGAWLCGLDYIDATNIVYQTFVWQRGGPGMTLLGQYGPCDTRSVAYAVSNTGTAVGFSWNSSDGEVAAVWDTTGTWDTTGQARRLTDLLSAAGVDVSGWTKLQRALAISNDGMVVAGWGIWAADSSVRGFVAKLTEPLPTIPVPVLGACCVSEGPNAGTCSLASADACANTPFGQYLGDNTCCDACPGACCNADATCSMESATTCTTGGGFFHGASAVCANVSCEGACCVGFGTCEQTVYGTCEGDFSGVGVSCETAACPCSTSTQVWADTDSDGDVDMADYGYLQACLTLTNNGVPAECICLNRVSGEPETVDAADLLEFTKCATGAALVWTPLLTPACIP